MIPTPLIACARCAISKARCDRKVPCSQCVARGYVCQPRCTSRKPRAQRRPAVRNQGGLTTPMETAEATSNPAINMEQFKDFMMAENRTNNNQLFDFSNPVLQQDALDITSYEDFMGCVPCPSTTNGGETTEPNVSNPMFSPMPWMSVSGNGNVPIDFQMSLAPVSSDFQGQRNVSLGPAQLPTPPSTTERTTHSPQNASGSMKKPYACSKVHETGTGTSDDALWDMVELLTHPTSWSEVPRSAKDAEETLSHDERDRIVATVQLLLHGALQARSASSPTKHGLFGSIVALPPSHVLRHFVELYASRVDSIQPYLGVPGIPTLSIKNILNVDMADVGIIAVILIISQGAMLTDHRESLILAHGLTEVCRLALNDIIESKSMAEPAVGQTALQLLTLCAWSGRQSFNSFAISKRGQYLSILKETGLLEPDTDTKIHLEEGRNAWERWKKIEQQSRHVYAWVYVDLELSLLHDLPPILSINDLLVPLPQETDIWHAQSYKSWIEHYSSRGISVGEEAHSLNSLFRKFLQGRLNSNTGLSFHQLRLLLHPLQAMVLDQQQFLRIFDSEEPSNGYRVLSKIKILGRLQETQDLLQQLTLLLSRTTHSEAGGDKDGLARSMCRISMIMVHLVSLNVHSSIPEIERCAKEEPPPDEGDRAEAWRWARYSDGESYILFHSGQIFRLINDLHIRARPTWWPVAMYRAALACWSLRSLSRKSYPNHPHEVNIDDLLPHEDERLFNSSAGTAVVTLPDGQRLPILDGNNSLQYCTVALRKHPSRLVRSIIEKVNFFADRWA